MSRKTALYDRHLAAGARIVDFAGWDMPLHYGSQIEEHHCVRRAAGLFDVSHMCAVDVRGPAATAYLRQLLANDVATISAGRALYSCMLRPDGGVIDDLIVYALADGAYRIVVNAGTADKDLAWMSEQMGPYEVRIEARRDLGILALQGPQAREFLLPVLPERLRNEVAGLKAFTSADLGDRLVARTGYTGEDGYELILPVPELPQVWDALIGAGVAPVGLGARDTLRLEAGMSLYGQDMDETVSPLACGLAWTVAFEPSERDFNGQAALLAQREQGELPRFAGLVLDGRGVMRAGQTVATPAGAGVITSGGFSPTMAASIALARLPAGDYERLDVDIRGKAVPARVVRPPFVRKGQILV